MASQSTAASWSVWIPIPRAAAAMTARASAPKRCGFFSSDACGSYGLPDVTIVPSERNAPADATGEFELKSAKGNVVLKGGCGLLLRVVNPGFPGA